MDSSTGIRSIYSRSVGLAMIIVVLLGTAAVIWDVFLPSSFHEQLVVDGVQPPSSSSSSSIKNVLWTTKEVMYSSSSTLAKNGMGDETTMEHIVVSNNNNNVTQLSRMVLRSILSNEQKIGVSHNNNNNKSLTYYALVPPCTIVKNNDNRHNDDHHHHNNYIQDDVVIVESLSLLLVATAIVKADNETQNLFNMWEFLNTLWLAPRMDHESSSSSSTAKTFFLPKYIYPIKNRITSSSSTSSSLSTTTTTQYRNGSSPVYTPRYIPHTKLPNWSLFYPSTNHSTISPIIGQDDDVVRRSICTNNNTTTSHCWIGSGRISSIPFHATFLLKMISKLEENENSLHEEDITRLQGYFDRIYLYHQYLHDVVMRGCDSSSSSYGKNNNQKSVPCYNIVHPWESLMDQASPAWKVALQPTRDRIRALNWSLVAPLPKEVQGSYDFDANTYSAMIFLTECLANQTTIISPPPLNNSYFPYNGFDQDLLREAEERILKHCPFAMLDVGYASALAQADADLIQVATWISAHSDNLSSTSWSWNARLVHLSEWKQQSENVLDLLWSEEDQSYLSKYAVSSPVSRSSSSEKVDDSDGDDLLPSMEFCMVPVANNFMMFWHKELQEDKRFQPRLEKMALQLLRHSGPYSFDCGPFPLWSRSCDLNNQQKGRPIIDPKLNYFVGTGLVHNQANVAAFGEFMTESSIQLICENHKNNSSSVWNEQTPDNQCADNATWLQEAYDVKTTPFPLDSCGSSSTATGAILFHLLVSDHDFAPPVPIPPIRNSWVITLITLELMVAFSVGVTCVCLSLGLVRHENRRSRTFDVPDTGDDSQSALLTNFEAVDDNLADFLNEEVTSRATLERQANPLSSPMDE